MAWWTLPATPRPQTRPVTSCHCGLSDHFRVKTLILTQKNPGSGGMANINKCLMISVCFLFPVITEIIGLRWGGGCRWDKMKDLNFLGFPSPCPSIPSMGESVKTNKSNQNREQILKGEAGALLADLTPAALSLRGPCSCVSSDSVRS